MGFFGEWEEGKKGKRNTFLLLILAFLVGTILTSVFNNFPAQQGTAQVFITLLLVTAFLIVIETMFEKKNFYRTLGLGEKPLIALVCGTVVGFLLQVTSFSIATPFSAVISSDVVLTFFFVVVAAAIVEEMFFRGVFQPVFTGLLTDYFKWNETKAGITAMVLQASMFAWFHWRVMNGSFQLLLPTFIFAILVTIGNYYFKSIGFGIGVHFTNNLLIWFVGLGFFG